MRVHGCEQMLPRVLLLLVAKLAASCVSSGWKNCVFVQRSEAARGAPCLIVFFEKEAKESVPDGVNISVIQN